MSLRNSALGIPAHARSKALRSTTGSPLHPTRNLVARPNHPRYRSITCGLRRRLVV